MWRKRWYNQAVDVINCRFPRADSSMFELALQAEITRFENLPGRAKLQEYLRQLCAALHQVYKMRNPTGANMVDATDDRGYAA